MNLLKLKGHELSKEEQKLVNAGFIVCDRSGGGQWIAPDWESAHLWSNVWESMGQTTNCRVQSA